MTDSPLVSIVTPSYNQGQFIEETLLSVLNQDYPKIEYLVMDGGSRDQTLDVLKKYEGRLTYVSEKDAGQSDAINKGFRRAKGEILAWLNSDDTYLPHAVEKAVAYLGEHPDTDMVYGEGYFIEENGDRMKRYYTEPFDLQKLSERCYICQPTVFLRRRVLSEVGLLDARKQFCFDYEYWIRIGQKLKVGFLPEYLANSRLHPATKTLSQRIPIHDEIIPMIKEHYGTVPASWILSDAHARLEPRLRRKGETRDYLFPFLLGARFLQKYIAVNHSIPVSDFFKYVVKFFQKAARDLRKGNA